MPRIAKAASKPGTTATIGFEATAKRGSATFQSGAILRSLSAEKENLWLTAAVHDGASLPTGADLSSLSGSKRNPIQRDRADF